MVKLIWTDQAITDLVAIGDYIAENSEKHAKLIVKDLFDRTEILKRYPLAGRIVPEKNDEKVREQLREIIGLSKKWFRTTKLVY